MGAGVLRVPVVCLWIHRETKRITEANLGGTLKRDKPKSGQVCAAGAGQDAVVRVPFMCINCWVGGCWRCLFGAAVSVLVRCMPRQLLALFGDACLRWSRFYLVCSRRGAVLVLRCSPCAAGVAGVGLAVGVLVGAAGHQSAVWCAQGAACLTILIRVPCWVAVGVLKVLW